MTLYKEGTCDSSIVVSSSVYSCTSCGHTEIVDGSADAEKNCPKCNAPMRLISSQAGALESDKK